MKLTEEHLYKILKEQFYIKVPFLIEKSVINEAVAAFLKFLNEPDKIKNHIDFSIAPKHRRGDVGFKHRKADEGIYSDNKDFFHFHPAIFKQYDNFLKANPVVNDFILKAMPIWELSYKAVHQILSIFENKFPGIVDKVLDDKKSHLLLRFLKYEWEDSGKYLAKPHFDAGAFTLAIGESGPGLRIGSNNDNLKAIEHKDREAVFMLSSNFKKVLNTDELYTG